MNNIFLFPVCVVLILELAEAAVQTVRKKVKNHIIIIIIIIIITPFLRSVG
jgi:hypothetical protein